MANYEESKSKRKQQKKRDQDVNKEGIKNNIIIALKYTSVKSRV
jgi:hypothetical protein